MIEVVANGASVPAIGLGTWDLRGDACASIVEQAIGAGYRHIDTAIMYENEADVGAGIRASGIDRDSLFVTTKVWPDNLTQCTFQDAVRGSLNRLELDRVDLLLIHWPPKGRDDVGEWMRLLNDAAEQDWTRYIGVSNFTVDQLNRAVAESAHPPVCNQVESHPYIDQRKARAVADRHGMALTAYCPLYRGGPLFEEAAITEPAKAYSKSPAQIVLRWHVQSGCVAIPKTATPERLAENIDIFDFKLTEPEMGAIDALTFANSRLCDWDLAPDWDQPDAA